MLVTDQRDPLAMYAHHRRRQAWKNEQCGGTLCGWRGSMAIPKGDNMERGIKMMMRGKLNSVAMNDMSRMHQCAAPGNRRGIQGSLG